MVILLSFQSTLIDESGSTQRCILIKELFFPKVLSFSMGKFSLNWGPIAINDPSSKFINLPE